ncbi:hypothetical protein HNY73_014879 [Argiope bruennichi]|uniref:Gustatory receptor n=1 Tax=Argiope bruennichi TaxID=94029 RepID=A0A8T0ERX9_ARGBR|nr:hypothetical protein HNY73_014879 [Argiope bruennichi]
MFYSLNKKVKSLQKNVEMEDTLFSNFNDSLKERRKIPKGKKSHFYLDESQIEKNPLVFSTNLKIYPNKFHEKHKSVDNKDNEVPLGDPTNEATFKPTGIFSLIYKDKPNFSNVAKESEILYSTMLGNENYKKQIISTKHKADHTVGRKIQNLTRRFTHIAALVQDTDDIFSLQVLTILTISFARTCTYIYIYISSDWKNHDSYAGASIVSQIFFDFLAFGSVAIQASLVTEEAKKFAPLVIRLPQVGGCKDIKSLLQSETAALTACATNVQLTAWKFFNVSRNFIPTVIGVTVTYVIVILQLYQVVQDSQCMKRISNQ